MALEAFAETPKTSRKGQSMSETNNKRVVIAGGTGFLGAELGIALVQKGYQVHIISRDPASHRGRLAFPCDQSSYEDLSQNPSLLEGASGIINLAGASIAEGRWTASRRKILRDSRLKPTQVVVDAINRVSQKPTVLLQASAVGIYGEGFGKTLCEEWEASAQKVDSSCRLILARIGPVLGWEGGAFAKLSQLYGAGLGAQLGDGSQWFSSIHIDDLVNAMIFGMENESLEGPINFVGQENATNHDLHKILCQTSRSFRFMASPGVILKAMLGEASTLLLQGPNIDPTKLLEAGFRFTYPTLKKSIEGLQLEQKEPTPYRFKKKQWLPQDPDKVWTFFNRAQNLEKITPPWLSFHIEGTAPSPIQSGDIINYRLKIHGIPARWRSEISDVHAPNSFIDRQLKGPYKTWCHLHQFKPLGTGTLILDSIDYDLPMGWLGLPALPFVTKDVGTIFNYRVDTVAQFAEDPTYWE